MGEDYGQMDGVEVREMQTLIQQLQEIEKVFMELARQNTRSKPDALSWNAYRISGACGKAAEELKRNIPQEMEVEGGGSSWWYVCPDCHGAVDKQDRFCRHCGQAVKE